MSQTDEPYTVLSLRKVGELRWEIDANDQLVPVPPGIFRYEITYRNYHKHNRTTVHAKDELEAFMKGQERLKKTKKHYDRYGKNKEQTNVNR